MNFLKKIRLNVVMNAVLLLIMGILLIVDPFSTTNSIAWFAGVIVLVNGIIDIVRYITSAGYDYFVRGNLFAGILKCVLGIFMFSHTELIVTLFSCIFSILVIINGVNCMENSLQLKRADVPGWGLNIALSFIVLVGGIIMLFVPFSAVSTAAMIAGVVLVVDALTELFTAYRMSKIAHGFYDAFKMVKDEIEGNIIDQ